MFSELNERFRKSRNIYFDDVIVINSWSHRLTLLLAAILIPAFCAYFYYLQFGYKYVQFGVIDNHAENLPSLMVDGVFDVDKTYVLYEKSSGKTFVAKIVGMTKG